MFSDLRPWSWFSDARWERKWLRDNFLDEIKKAAQKKIVSTEHALNEMNAEEENILKKLKSLSMTRIYGKK